jgi:hypothetical protein
MYEQTNRVRRFFMSKGVQKIESGVLQELERMDDSPLAPVERPRRGNSFFSFTYSYHEISTFGEKTYVKSKQTRFEDGRLTSENFEGTLPRAAYDDAVVLAQQFWLNQMTQLLKGFSLFLPFRRK